MPATKIKIQALDHGKRSIYLELPITSLEFLEDQTPASVLSRIKENEINFTEIKAAVVAADYEPRELFKLQAGTKDYTVWID